MTLPRSFVRPLVRPMVRSGAVGPYGGATYQDGIHLNFASGNTTSGYYVKAVGAAPTVSPLTSLFTFTGGNQSMYMGGGGLLVASATNTPRIEYDASGNCLGLLMEAARTNLIIQSQDLSGLEWTKVRSSVSSNATAAPDGTTTADALIEDSSAAATHRMATGASLTVVAATTYTFSCFIKAAGRTRGQLRFVGAADTDGVTIEFNLSAGTASGAASIGTGSGATGSIQALPNGWYRVWVTGALNGGLTAANPRVGLEDASGNLAYNGDGASGLHLWGFQVEAGAFPSSYIPTTTGSVARTADSCIRTLGSEFSATAGTVVVAGRASGGQDASIGQNTYSFDDTTVNNRFNLTRPVGSDVARWAETVGGVNQALLDATWINATSFKHAAAWALNDFAASFNGAAVVTDGVGTLPTVTVLGVGVYGTGTAQANGHILRFDYYPTRLPNTYLVSAST